MRLLYVAMTRAELWLIVAGAGDLGEGTKSWYSLVSEALKSDKTVSVSAQSAALAQHGEIVRFASGQWPEPRVQADEALQEKPPLLPDWATIPAAPAVRQTSSLVPSDLGGAKALPGETAMLDPEAAKRRGTMLHLLLEHLPELPRPEWPQIARALLSVPEFASDLAETETILAQATRVLGSAAMRPFLQPGALSEVGFTAPLPEWGGRVMHGTIDRLVITADCIHVLDYKSNATVPSDPGEVPLGILRQMAAYRAALRQIYPGQRIECTILWTATAEAMTLPEAQLDAALCADTGS